MNFSIRRTVASELTLWLSMITTIIAILIGVAYYLYASSTITRDLLIEAEQTAEEFSQLLILPLYNFNQEAAREAAKIYLTSGRVKAIHIQAKGIGEIFNNLDSASSSLPLISRDISKDELSLGSVELVFSDLPVLQAKKRAIWTTLIAVSLILLTYSLSLRLILRHILIKPLTTVGSRLKEIADGGFEGSLSPVPQKDLNTIVIAANKMSEEITARTKAVMENERHYRQIYNATSDAIFIHDSEDGTIVDVNQSVLDMYGYSRQEVMSMSVGDRSQGDAPYSQQDAEDNLAKALHEGPHVFKWRAKRKDGSLFWVEVSLKKTVLGDQEVVLALSRDISQRQHLEDELRQAQKMEAIGTLAGGIAHDFNNILTTILGYTELSQIALDKTSPIFANLQQVEKASKRARDLVKQILTFSRKQQLEKKVLRLAPIVNEAIHLLRASIPTTVTILQDLDSQAKVQVDPGQMHQIVMNLCTNGCQAMVNDSGTLTVALKDTFIGEHDSIELTPGKYVILEVTDDGSGMDKETKRKIFEPFFTTKGPDEGTGMGLAVIHGIVKDHQGRTTVYSEPGLGTTFRVYLPVADGELEREEPPGEKVTTGTGGDKRVMVVDDEESIRDVMEQLLIHGGYQVNTFADGGTAYQSLSAEPAAWDLLITDLTMPGMTGMELADKVSSLRPEMPIILCTGYGDMQNGNGNATGTISSSLQKPVTMEELLTTAARVLHKKPSEEK